MSEEEGPLPRNATPFDAYKAIIDQCVDKTNNYGYQHFVRKHGFFSRAPDHAEYNAFIKSLSRTQVEMLAEMLRHERYSAVHDVLALLSWWIDCWDVALTYRGEPMPAGVEGGMHNDYVGRLDGWQWPKEAPPEGGDASGEH